MVSGPSTSTLINKALTGNSDFSMQVLHEDINKKNLALKLNCLKENSPRYESHNDFQSKLYLKYIEIFFFNEINKKHHSIKFVKKYSKSEIVFLDVLICKDEQQRLQTTIFK